MHPMYTRLHNGRWLTLFAIVVLSGFTRECAAQDIPFDEGSVWNVTYVRTEPGQFDAYMENLKQNWKRFMDKSIERGYVRSYKVISAEPANREDWDLMLLVEYPNMAALDNMREKMEPIQNELIGTRQQAAQANGERRQLREIMGGKLGRELVFTK